MRNIKISSVLPIILTCLLHLFETTSVLAQISWNKTCGAEYLHSEETNRYAEWAAVPDTIIIPVVFHILTQGGVENISKEQVLDALRILNEDFSNRNPDTLDIPIPFQNVRGNPKIEFRLARIDPKGNCTDGIDRIYTPYTYGTGGTGNIYEFQKLFDWDHMKYYNIFVVNWLDSPNNFMLVGGSHIPSITSIITVPENRDVFGICYHDLNENRTITHEMGHFTGLLHPWGEGDIGNNCIEDDDISDTPKQSGPNYYCPSFPHISCENVTNGDMFNNFMDYTECTNMFTAGQVNHMRSVLTINPWRNVHWTSENNQLTGVNNDLPKCNLPPIADFGYGNFANWLAAESKVSFNEACSWDPDSFFWQFEGGIPAISAEKFPQVIFPDTGFHRITLRVSNTFGSDTISKNVYISPKEKHYDEYMTESFENHEETKNLVNVNFLGSSWASTDKASKSGAKSFYNSGNSQYLSGFFTHIFDLGNTSVSGRKLVFDIALGMSASGNEAAGLRVLWKRPFDFERSELLATNNSKVKSKPLHTEDALTSETLKTATTNTTFIPNANQWKTITLSIPDTLTGEIQVGFLWANFIPTSKFKGLYIDNIRITGTTKVNEVETSKPFLAFPNPTSDYFSLDIPADISLVHAAMEMYDLYGRLVISKKGVEILGAQDISSLTNGIYIIELRENGRIFRSKLLLTK